MANPVAVDAWTGNGVRLGDVVEALGDLRHQAAGGHDNARTAVMTLLAVAPEDEQAYPAVRALRALGGQHPARIVVLRPDPDEVATLNARASLYAADAGDHHVTFEEVVLEVGGQAAHHLDSLVEAFTLADLPIVVWYVGSVPETGDSLLRVAGAVLVDSRDAADSGRLRSVLELARRRTVVDLSWIRLQPWRELAASLFDPPENRRWLEDVEGVTVKGKVGPRRLLGGWLASRLRVPPERVHLVDAAHVEIQLACRLDGAAGTFEVVRGDRQRTVRARALLPAGSEERGPIELADDPLTISLARGLAQLEPDTVWNDALSTAVALAP